MMARRNARALALQALYAMDTQQEWDAAAGLPPFDEGRDSTSGPIDRAFAEALVQGVVERRATIDEMLGTLSKNWRIERMAQVDRNILRIALFELKYRDDLPAQVTLNEAIELGKRFGTAETYAFINGLLDSALKVLQVHK
jgi:N utilization substance protein B